MDISKMVAELRAERALLDEVISSLEKLSTGPRKRGRPRGTHIKLASFPAGDTDDSGTPDLAACFVRRA